ncbi:MAG TPA: ATP-grasp fold amidoligase family protein [Synergistales bacterium]|nr:ATP-grasp fold amidoligase family protein [Synergistales bacterium]
MGHLSFSLRLALEKIRFYRKLGYPCNLKDPKTFNEKVFWRKVYDRNPLFPVLADKYRSRQYIRNLIGDQRAEEILVPLYHVTSDPETIPFDNLPSEYMIKANHGCGWVLPVKEGMNFRREKVISRTRQWLRTVFGVSLLEWAYSEVTPLIMIEKLLQENGKIPWAYKFFVCSGRVVFFLVVQDRFTDLSVLFFDRNMSPVHVRTNWAQGPGIKKPRRFKEMIRLAEELAQGLDFLRVDLYNLRGKIYFGEFTVYPGSATSRYPFEFDLEIGRKWDLPPKGLM